MKLRGHAILAPFREMLRRLRTCIVLLATGISMVSGGCAGVPVPPGYEQVESHSNRVPILHTRGWLIGRNKVSSYDLPDGRKLQYRITAVATGRRTDGAYDYDLRLDDDAGALRLRCRSNTVADRARTRVACRLGDESAPVVFTLAPDVPGCQSDVWWRRVESNPACFEGELSTPHGRYAVVFGHLDAPTIVVGRVAWTSRADGSPVQAMATFTDHQLQLFQAPSLDPADADLLLMHAVALHLWAQRQVVYIAH
jgi:hypothetical protein